MRTVFHRFTGKTEAEFPLATGEREHIGEEEIESAAAKAWKERAEEGHTLSKAKKEPCAGP